MIETLFIYGNGGFGKEVFDIAKRTKKFENIYFLDDNNSSSINVFSLEEAINFSNNNSAKFILGIGDPSTRIVLYNKLLKHKCELTSIVDPTAIISDKASIGKGVVICAFGIVGPDTIIGNNVVLNVQGIIGHDINICDHCVLSSQVNIGGGSTIGQGSYIGMASIVKEGIEIGDGSVLGMGSSLHRNLDSNLIAMGNPARPLKKIDKNYKVFNKKIYK